MLIVFGGAGADAGQGSLRCNADSPGADPSSNSINEGELHSELWTLSTAVYRV